MAMTALQIYNEIVVINEKVVAGILNINQAEFELANLKINGKEAGIVIDVVALVDNMKKDLASRGLEESAAVVLEDPDFDSSYTNEEADEDFDSSYASSYSD